jgi:chaperonin GroES
MKELQAINQNVIIDLSETSKEQKTAGGIIIPDTAKEKPNYGKIINMSAIENAEVKVGDVIVYKSYSGNEIEFEGKKYLILPYSDILAKIVDVEEI